MGAKPKAIMVSALWREYRKPWALTLPHSAPSMAINTGSGLTLRAQMPSSSRSFCESNNERKPHKVYL